MTRFLLILSGVLCGLLLVVLSEGRVGHLRAFAPQMVPGWAAPIDNGATLWQGRARGIRPLGFPVETDLSWRFARLRAFGAIWDLSAMAPGLSGRAELDLPLARDRAELRDGRAEVLLGDWPGLVRGVTLDGLLEVAGLHADLALPERSLRAFGADIRWTGARINGQDIGTGEMTVLSDQGGGWRAPFSLEGDVVVASGTLEGRFGAPVAVLDLRIENAGGMPIEWQKALDRVARRVGTSWIVRRDLDLSLEWPLL